MKTLNKVKCVYVMLLAACSLGCLPGCAAKRIEPAQITRDSVAVVVRHSIVWHKVLARFDIPDIREKRVTRDTTSRLENDYAESTAAVSDGVLTHTLNTKPQSKEVDVDVPSERVDTTIYKYQFIKTIKEVAAPLTWWQETQIKGFWAMVSILAVFILWKFFRSKFGGFLSSIANLFKGI